MFTPSETLFTFQFTPLREGRQEATEEQLKLFQFQFTPLREGRPVLRHSACKRRSISIHAPPRGATASERYKLISKPFQFTPLREGRPDARHDVGHLLAFQFTPLREGRLLSPLPKGLLHNFNSRPSARGDARLVEKRIHEGQISIHAPPRGATLDGVHRVLILLFQFTPLREGRPAPPPNRRSAAYFNSRPSARGDVVLCRYEFAPDNFNSRPSARGDGTSTSLYPRGLFQFTPLREGRPGTHSGFSRLFGNFNSRPSARGDAPIVTLPVR